MRGAIEHSVVGNATQLVCGPLMTGIRMPLGLPCAILRRIVVAASQAVG
jgi:hypothetical protein